MTPTAEATPKVPAVESTSREIILGYRVHAAATLLPDPSPEEFDRLVGDIEKHGILSPVTLILGYDNEKEILDGRSRARAWEKLGRPRKDLPTESLEDALPKDSHLFLPDNDGDAVAFVLSKNLARRHLTTSQRADIGARLATMRQGEGKCAKLRIVSQGEAAKMMKVSRRSVQTAKQVRKADPKVADKVARGEITLNKGVTLLSTGLGSAEREAGRLPRCAHGYPRANCPECCPHGKLPHRCIACNGKANTLPAVSSKPTKLPTAYRGDRSGAARDQTAPPSAHREQGKNLQRFMYLIVDLGYKAGSHRYRSDSPDFVTLGQAKEQLVTLLKSWTPR